MRYILSPKARADVILIWLRIALDSEAAADEVEAAIFCNCELLVSSPRIGHTRSDLVRKTVLVWPALPFEKYLIVYQIQPDHIYILRVLHSARRKVWKRGI